METWEEHQRRVGENHKCPRCRCEWPALLTFQGKSGGTGTWVYEKCTPDHPWGLGCKTCLWNHANTAMARGEVSRDRGTALQSLLRRGNHLPRQQAGCKRGRGKAVPRTKAQEGSDGLAGQLVQEQAIQHDLQPCEPGR